MFTEQDLNAAIDAGIFDKHNNITATNPAQIIRFLEIWAKVRIRDVRHEAAEIALRVGQDLTADQAHQLIMNIRN